MLTATHPWIIALTGASGTCYGRRLISVLLEQIPELKLEIVISEAALRVMREEENIGFSVGRIKLSDLIGFESSRATIHSNRNIGANIASGSYLTSGMVIIPCSMRTLAAVTHGLADNLIHRAADVTLKEGRQLIVVPRETPLSRIHLSNMLRLAELNAKIIPAMPGFYNKPQTISDLVDDLVLRTVDQMGLSVTLGKRWGKEKSEEKLIGAC